MKKISFSLIIISTLIHFSCKKESCNSKEEITVYFDTVAMHPYFPAYPGSFWEYNDGSETTIGDYAFKKFNYRTEQTDTCETEFNTVQLAADLSQNQYLIGNRVFEKFKLTNFQAYNTSYLIVDTILGKQIMNFSYNYGDTPGNSHNEYITGYVQEKLPHLTIQDTTYSDVIKVIKYRRVFGNDINTTIETHLYYAKNVGLIVEEQLDNFLVPSYRKELINFNINY